MRTAGLNRKKNNNLKYSVNKRYNFKMLRKYLYPKVSEIECIAIKNEIVCYI